MSSSISRNNNSSSDIPKRRNRRTKGRQLFCPIHQTQHLEGNGRKYFLHLLSPTELQQRGLSSKKARLVINAYPVLVLSSEWLEELYCPMCGCLTWFHVIKHDRVNHSVRKAPRDLWEQVAHVDPIVANPTVSEYSRNAARRNNVKRIDGKRYYD